MNERPAVEVRLRRYAWAIAIMAVAVGVRYALNPLLGRELPFTPLLGAVVVSVWVCGEGPAIVAAFLGYLAARALFLAPEHIFTFDSTTDVLHFVVYAITSLLIVAFGTTLRETRQRSRTLAAARARAEAERERLVAAVESSTDFVGMSDLNGIPFYLNRAAREMVGIDSLEEARHTPFSKLIFPEDRAKIFDEFIPKVRRDGHGEIDVRFRHLKTGEARWMAYKLMMLRDADGMPIGFATVSQDVTERRRLAEELRVVAANLSEANRRKSEFLAMLAHELRNPLAPLSNMLEVLKRSHDDSPIFREACSTMERQLGQMVRLVDDLLDLNRISHNRLELRTSEVTLASVVLQAVETSRPLIEASGHTLRVSIPDDPIYLDADPARLAQVFGNLLNNSSKYTRPGGHISVEAVREDGTATVTVADTGVGIPPEKLDTIFDMFTQLDRSLERAQGGLGLGLTLARNLVQMHGGSIEAHSPGPDGGSEFVVRLPVAAATRSAAGAPHVRDAHGAVTRRILVVDDNEDAAHSLSMLLEMMGHETASAHDGGQALSAIEKYRPDVVLLDIGLPVLNGYEVCRRVREEPWGKDIAIIALTGWGQDEDRRRSVEAGFNGHLVKPVAPHVLSGLLDSLPAPAAH